MINKINRKPYPYMSLWQFLKYELEGLNNTYSRQKENGDIEYLGLNEENK